MKFLLFILFLVTVYFFDYSLEQTTNDNQQATEIHTTITTTPWWTRTFPIIQTRTVTTRQAPPPRTTTAPNRVSNAVSIAVPVALFGITLLVAYGLIVFAITTGGNGRFFLTRTNERLIP